MVCLTSCLVRRCQESRRSSTKFRQSKALMETQLDFTSRSPMGSPSLPLVLFTCTGGAWHYAPLRTLTVLAGGRSWPPAALFAQA